MTADSELLRHGEGTRTRNSAWRRGTRTVRSLTEGGGSVEKPVRAQGEGRALLGLNGERDPIKKDRSCDEEDELDVGYVVGNKAVTEEPPKNEKINDHDRKNFTEKQDEKSTRIQPDAVKEVMTAIKLPTKHHEETTRNKVSRVIEKDYTKQSEKTVSTYGANYKGLNETEMNDLRNAFRLPKFNLEETAVVDSKCTSRDVMLEV